MSAVPRELLVLRHAKAEQFAATDHDRRLTDRGRIDAADVGAWLQAQGLLPDHAVVSSAARTQGTWGALSDAAGLSLEPTLDRALYAAGTEAALEIVRYLPAGSRRALLVGHNPTMAALVHLLEDGESDDGLFDQVASGYPTAMLSVLRFSGDWVDLEPGGARLVGVHLGRG